MCWGTFLQRVWKYDASFMIYTYRMLAFLKFETINNLPYYLYAFSNISSSSFTSINVLSQKVSNFGILNLCTYVLPIPKLPILTCKPDFYVTLNGSLVSCFLITELAFWLIYLVELFIFLDYLIVCNGLCWIFPFVLLVLRFIFISEFCFH